ncbi:MAG: chemotaxis protein CheY-P-specific phosphatase CheC [Rhodoferax sp.]|jgi:chemotaxis protein CheY-P-specific phosphatase CheC
MAMELYESYRLNMGIPKSELSGSHTSDEVSDIMGELMNQIVGDFTGKVRRQLQTHITQTQPKMLVLNKQVVLSAGTHLDNPEARRVTFYIGRNNIFYLELAIDKTEFIKLHDFDANEVIDPDELMSQVHTDLNASQLAQKSADQDELLKSLGVAPGVCLPASRKTSSL